MMDGNKRGDEGASTATGLSASSLESLQTSLYSVMSSLRYLQTESERWVGKSNPIKENRKVASSGSCSTSGQRSQPEMDAMVGHFTTFLDQLQQTLGDKSQTVSDALDQLDEATRQLNRVGASESQHRLSIDAGGAMLVDDANEESSPTDEALFATSLQQVMSSPTYSGSQNLKLQTENLETFDLDDISSQISAGASTIERVDEFAEAWKGIVQTTREHLKVVAASNYRLEEQIRNGATLVSQIHTLLDRVQSLESRLVQAASHYFGMHLDVTLIRNRPDFRVEDFAGEKAVLFENEIESLAMKLEEMVALVAEREQVIHILSSKDGKEGSSSQKAIHQLMSENRAGRVALVASQRELHRVRTELRKIELESLYRVGNTSLELEPNTGLLSTRDGEGSSEVPMETQKQLTLLADMVARRDEDIFNMTNEVNRLKRELQSEKKERQEERNLMRHQMGSDSESETASMSELRTIAMAPRPSTPSEDHVRELETGSVLFEAIDTVRKALSEAEEFSQTVQASRRMVLETVGSTLEAVSRTELGDKLASEEQWERLVEAMEKEHTQAQSLSDAATRSLDKLMTAEEMDGHMFGVRKDGWSPTQMFVNHLKGEMLMHEASKVVIKPKIRSRSSSPRHSPTLSRKSPLNQSHRPTAVRRGSSSSHGASKVLKGKQSKAQSMSPSKRMGVDLEDRDSSLDDLDLGERILIGPGSTHSELTAVSSVSSLRSEISSHLQRMDDTEALANQLVGLNLKLVETTDRSMATEKELKKAKSAAKKREAALQQQCNQQRQELFEAEEEIRRLTMQKSALEKENTDVAGAWQNVEASVRRLAGAEDGLVGEGRGGEVAMDKSRIVQCIESVVGEVEKARRLKSEVVKLTRADSTTQKTKGQSNDVMNYGEDYDAIVETLSQIQSTGSAALRLGRIRQLYKQKLRLEQSFSGAVDESVQRMSLGADRSANISELVQKQQEVDRLIEEALSGDGDGDGGASDANDVAVKASDVAGQGRDPDMDVVESRMTEMMSDVQSLMILLEEKDGMILDLQRALEEVHGGEEEPVRSTAASPLSIRHLSSPTKKSPTRDPQTKPSKLSLGRVASSCHEVVLLCAEGVDKIQREGSEDLTPIRRLLESVRGELHSVMANLNNRPRGSTDSAAATAAAASTNSESDTTVTIECVALLEALPTLVESMLASVLAARKEVAGLMMMDESKGLHLDDDIVSESSVWDSLSMRESKSSGGLAPTKGKQRRDRKGNSPSRSVVGTDIVNEVLAMVENRLRDLKGATSRTLEEIRSEVVSPRKQRSSPSPAHREGRKASGVKFGDMTASLHETQQDLELATAEIASCMERMKVDSNKESSMYIRSEYLRPLLDNLRETSSRAAYSTTMLKSYAGVVFSHSPPSGTRGIDTQSALLAPLTSRNVEALDGDNSAHQQRVRDDQRVPATSRREGDAAKENPGEVLRDRSTATSVYDEYEGFTSKSRVKVVDERKKATSGNRSTAMSSSHKKQTRQTTEKGSRGSKSSTPFEPAGSSVLNRSGYLATNRTPPGDDRVNRSRPKEGDENCDRPTPLRKSHQPGEFTPRGRLERGYSMEFWLENYFLHMQRTGLPYYHDDHCNFRIPKAGALGRFEHDVQANMRANTPPPSAKHGYRTVSPLRQADSPRGSRI